MSKRKKTLIIVCGVLVLLCLSIVALSIYANNTIEKTKLRTTEIQSEYNSMKEKNSSFDELQKDLRSFVGSENFYSVLCINSEGTAKISFHINPITNKYEFVPLFDEIMPYLKTRLDSFDVPFELEITGFYYSNGQPNGMITWKTNDLEHGDLLDTKNNYSKKNASFEEVYNYCNEQ